jgi:uncharacterized membrane protein
VKTLLTFALFGLLITLALSFAAEGKWLAAVLMAVFALIIPGIFKNV